MVTFFPKNFLHAQAPSSPETFFFKGFTWNIWNDEMKGKIYIPNQFAIAGNFTHGFQETKREVQFFYTYGITNGEFDGNFQWYRLEFQKSGSTPYKITERMVGLLPNFDMIIHDSCSERCFSGFSMFVSNYWR